MTVIVSGNEKEGWSRFTGSPNLDAMKVAQLVRDGVWTDDDLEKHGLKQALPFVAPEGKQLAGPPRFEMIKGVLRQVYDVEDALPEKEEEPESVLEGLSRPQIEQLIAVLNDELETRDEGPVFGGKT